jgi:enolase
VPCAESFSGSGRYGGGPPGATVGDKPSYSFPCFGFDSYSEAAYAGWEINRALRKVLNRRFDIGSKESGYSGIPPRAVEHDRELWAAMTEAIEVAGYSGRAGIQVDVAAGTYYDEERGVYTGLFSRGDKTEEELIEIYKEMVANYPVVILEDPLGEDDYVGHGMLLRELGIQIVGDDLFTTNPARLQQGIDVDGGNTMLLKVNQVGTITEAFDAVAMAYRAGWAVMPCASRGENDAMSDYTVGLGCGLTRGGGSGAQANRYLEIEAELGPRAQFVGKAALRVDWARVSI